MSERVTYGKRWSIARGFTLVEIVLVIIITAILVTVALRGTRSVSHAARVEETKQELRTLAWAVAGNPDLVENGVPTDFGYVGDVGSMPTSLNALHSNPGGYSTWHGPYVRNRSAQDGADYRTDAWGAAYVYSGGAEITSTGSGESLIEQIAPSTSDLLANTVTGNVIDLDGSPPGPSFASGVTVALTYPDGTGGLTTATIAPDAGGYFAFSAVPIGRHELAVVNVATADSLLCTVAVATRSAGHHAVRLNANCWYDTVQAYGAEGVFEVLRPNAPGASTQLTALPGILSGFACVDEPAADGDLSRVENAVSVWRQDTYGSANHSAGSGTVDSVQVRMRVRVSGGRARTVIRSGGSDYFGAEVSPGAVYATFGDTYVLDPATGLAWTWGGIDALEIGVSLADGARCTRVWLEVYYTE